MLRRLKETVASELPGKREVVLQAALGPYQAALMRLVRHGFEAAAGGGGGGGGGDGEKDGGGGGGATAVNRAVNNTVMEMRNICNHPFLRCGEGTATSTANRLHDTGRMECGLVLFGV
mgnify:CR=1 FL=1